MQYPKNPIEERIYKRLDGRVPPNALSYCFSLWKANPFRFVIRKERKTKTGDFSIKRNEQFAVITINDNLNCYSFLITYIHEVAHHHVYALHKSRVQPHGIEWKTTFQQLMQPILNPSIFPADILIQLQAHMRNPKASSHSDYYLSKALKAYDEDEITAQTVDELPMGSLFKLDNKTYKKLESRRTRVRCLSISNRKHYLVHKLAKVELI